jgi:hypothetical protein
MLKHSPRLRRGNIHWFRLGLVFGLVLVSSLVWSWFGLGFVFGFVLVWSWFGLWFGLGLVLVWSWVGLWFTCNLQPPTHRGARTHEFFLGFLCPPGGEE